MRFSVSIVAACVVVATPAQAANDQVRQGPMPDWVVQSQLMPVPDDASGLAFVRRHDSLVHLERTGQTHYVGYWIKILHPNALELGNLSIAWNPASGAPTVHAVQIHRDGQAIDVLENARFEILRREDQLEAARLDGVLTAVHRIADLRVGDELEVSYTTPAGDPTLGAKESGVLVLGPDPVAGRIRLGLSWDEGQAPRIKMAEEMAVVAERRERAFDFRFDNPAGRPPPKDAPPRFGWQRAVEFTNFADWPAVSRHFAPLYGKAAKLDAGSPLKEEARRIAAAHSSPLDRAAAALKLVQQQVRYIYVGLDGGNLMPATAEETWQRRFGDCKGKTALLLALLAELSIPAEPVLVNNAGLDDGLDERLPSPQLFDHVLVRARIGGSDYWLDGTLPPVVPPGAAPVLPYRWVLPLDAGGGSIERLPWRPQQKPDEITLHEIDAREGFDRPARIVNTNIVRGVAGLRQQVELSGVTPAQLLSGLRQQLVGDTWQAIDDVQWRYDVKAQASILTISGTGTVDWNDDGNGAKSMALPGGGFNPPEKRVRAAGGGKDVPFYSAPEYDCRVTTVRLPKATKVAHWSHNTAFGTKMFGRTYYRAFDIRDGAVRMVRGFRVDQPEIDAQTAERDNGRIGEFDNSMAWISYDPDGEESEPSSGAPVPATYEIDWTADSVPCLPRDAGD